MSRFCRPWWCRSGCHRFHLTDRKACISARDQRAIRWDEMKEAACWQARHEFAAWTRPAQIDSKEKPQ